MNEQFLRTRVSESLRQALKTMRDACDRAERDIDTADSTACQRVLHSLSWGMANASSSIETAMAMVEDLHVVKALALPR